MKVYPNRSLLDFHGRAIKQDQEKDAGETSLGAMLIEGLARDLPGDEGAGGTMKIKRYRLAQKIMGFMEANKDQEREMIIPNQDVEMILNRLGKFLPTMLLGPVHDAIDVLEGEEKLGEAAG
jgi:hypothetical protein